MANQTERIWADHVRRWRRSGLSARNYASREGLNATTLYGWSSRLRKEAGPIPAHFIEVAPPLTVPRGIDVRVGSAVTIHVEHGFDPQLLRDVVAALSAS